MNDLLNKISSYHLFNYLLPGCIFAVAAAKITHRGFLLQNVVLGLFFYYFYGLVISRVGSLLVEPFLKWTHFLEFADYNQTVAACKKDPKIEFLSESNNMYRTLLSLILVLVLLRVYTWIGTKLIWLRHWDYTILVFLLLAMFLFSYRKQTAYISKRVRANMEGKE